jgi:HemY protein
MIRTFFILAFFVAVGFVGSWLLDHPGEIVVNWLGYNITVQMTVLAVLLLLFVLFISWIAILLWRLITWPSRRRTRRAQRTLKRGLEQLTRGVTALAMGDEETAEEALKKARAALPGEPLPQLLTAQLLQRQGNQSAAQLQFRTLMSHPVTAELATRRLIEQHIERGEWAEATRLAEEARANAGKDRWLILILIDLYARVGNTKEMLALTEGWQWQSPLSKEERHRYAALAHYLMATKLTNPRQREQHLRHAVGYAPTFLPAVIDYAYLLLAEGSPRQARKYLLTAWWTNQTSLLIAPILATVKNDKPRAQTRLLRPFLNGEPSVPRHLLAARQAILLVDYLRASQELDRALELEENKEVLTLMADIARELHGDEAATSWLTRALNAPENASWVCNDCGAIHPIWASHCSSCHHFDSLHYERPETRITSVELATR